MNDRSCTPILMDVDTGVDDALALILALHSPAIRLEAVATVSGNTSAEQAGLNTRLLLDWFGRGAHVPVTTGEKCTLAGRVVEPVREIHGVDGLGGITHSFEIPPQEEGARAESSVRRSAAEFMAARAARAGDPLSLVATGPLTNVAKAIAHDRRSMAAFREICVMGGAVDVEGNVSRQAEFNVFCDPEAFHAVLTSGLPLTLFPLDVTQSVILHRSSLAGREEVDERKLRLIEAMTNVYMLFHRKRHGFDGCFMHDVLPVAYLIDPSLFSFETRELVVELGDGPRRGRLRAPRKGEQGGRVKVAKRVDAEGVLRLFWRELSRPEPELRPSVAQRLSLAEKGP